MKTKHLILFIGLFLALCSAGPWLFWPNPDPLFHGKPESVWIKGIDYSGGNEQTEQWRAFGPEGIRVLIRGLHKASRPWERVYRQTYRRFAPRLPLGMARLLPAAKMDAGRATRTCVVSLLCRLGNDARLATPAMVQALRDEDDDVRQLAINFFTSSEDEHALLNRLDAKTKRKVLPDFIRGIQDRRNPGMRNNAALALRYYPEAAEAVAPVLVKACQDSSPQVRLLAALALNRVDPQTARKAGAVSVLIKILRDINDQVAYRAARGLRDFAGQPELAVPALIESLRNPSTLVANEAVGTLESAFKAQAALFIPALRQAAQSRRAVARRAAAALQQLGAEVEEDRP